MAENAAPAEMLMATSPMGSSITPGAGGDDGAAAAPASRKKRGGISAEGGQMGSSEEAFTPVVVPKSKEAEEYIMAACQKSLLFSSLAAEELRIVVDAMFELKSSAGQVGETDGTDEPPTEPTKRV